MEGKYPDRRLLDACDSQAQRRSDAYNVTGRPKCEQRLSSRFLQVAQHQRQANCTPLPLLLSLSDEDAIPLGAIDTSNRCLTLFRNLELSVTALTFLHAMFKTHAQP